MYSIRVTNLDNPSFSVLTPGKSGPTKLGISTICASDGCDTPDDVNDHKCPCDFSPTDIGCDPLYEVNDPGRNPYCTNAYDLGVSDCYAPNGEDHPCANSLSLNEIPCPSETFGDDWCFNIMVDMT